VQLTKTLRRIPIFASLTENDLVDLASHLREVKYEKGSAIISVDDPGTRFFVVAKGKVKVVLYSTDGREVIFSLMKDGDFFGEMSLLDGKPRSATVIAQGDVSLLTLERDDFIKWLEGHPSAFMMLVSELSCRLREADEQIGSLALLDVYGRVARRMLDVARKEGKRVPGGILIAERPSQVELAGLVGASRETVARAMSEIQRRGFIRKRGHGLLLLGGKDLEAEVLG
jgi:CRP/FNR family transcriptional regulator/CRP/FNR family cyclic AMP-dependent transcriptional regulator